MQPHVPICVCAALRQAARTVTQLYDEALRPSGLRAMQFQILKTLEQVGEASTSDLAVVLSLDQTTLTRSLAILDRNGWLSKQATKDRRVKLYRLSKKGSAILVDATVRWESVQTKAVAQLGGDERWQAVRATLRTITAAAAEESGPAYFRSTSN